jgi:archaellum component FlaC
MFKLLNYTPGTNEQYYPIAFITDTEEVYLPLVKLTQQDTNTRIEQLKYRIEVLSAEINTLITELINRLNALNSVQVKLIEEQLLQERNTLSFFQSQRDPCVLTVYALEQLDLQITKQKSLINKLSVDLIGYKDLSLLTTEGELLVIDVTEQTDKLKEEINLYIEELNTLTGQNIEPL